MRILTVGHPKSKDIERLMMEYQKRLGPWVRLIWDFVPEISYRVGQESYAKKSESGALLAKISPKEFVILLDIDGEMVSSSELSQKLIEWHNQGRNVTFVVGGSLGVENELKTRANWRWSLSRLTFPHALAQLLLIEQLYRAWAIYHHHPYHK